MTARIAYIHSSTYFGSTEQSYVKPLLERLDRGAYEPWLVTPQASSLEPLHEASAHAEVLPLDGSASAAEWIRAYRQALRRTRPDVVHCTDVDSPALIATRLAGIRRVVVTHHTPEYRPAHSRAGHLLRRLAWATHPHVVFTSEFDRETGVRDEPISPARTSVIPLGLDLNRFTPAGSRERDGARVVGTVGLLKPQKGHRFLIEAAASVVQEEPDVRFVVVGDGDLRGELERDVRDRGLGGRFTFLGQRDDVPELVRGFDVFALCSTFEGMCLAVAEALAVETPVVATAVGGVRQTVVAGETGVLVPPRDPAALAEALLWTLRHPDEAHRMAHAGRERVTRLYPLDRMVAATSDLYARLLRHG